MSADNIKQAALVHFARDGYEGASLKSIADDCGIKKPSIYAHFSSKEHLFLQVLQDVFEQQERKIDAFFASCADQPLEEQLRGFLDSRQAAYELDDETRFFLRMSFFPPSSLYVEVMEEMVYPFIGRQEDMVTRLLDKGCPAHGDIIHHSRQAAIAYITLLDGIYVEILYGGKDRTARRIAAVWPVYWSGVTKE
ncbi:MULTISPECIES: TetR/AcrR family transcriptional regulator [Paenibacillus]|uniref:TetR family transcriptional regulator n=1 Tax=Paenibacillus campinasensis TaxID=66347 RepID=A0A268EVV9_9BACL|nr:MULTISPECIES: TetR/AcrR family transcriptional regulator [Paenibacillus]PAD77255.1 TetR family transcriptional regulator [Paenibacillus campinasensis]PAK52101.1 TetR family transcriptional regulator [Paenibacillus sp. 7541]